MIVRIMFFIAVTNHEIAQNFQSNSVEWFKDGSSIITVVTDDFLSRYFEDENGFIIRSPIISSQKNKDTIFSQIKYKTDEKELIILKSTISGSSIYYHINSKGDFYCSTHISMLRKAGVPIKENSEVLPEFFIYRYVMPPNSLYKNINHLFTGGKLYIKIADGKCVIKSIDYYTPPKQNDKLNSIKFCSQEINNLLFDSVDKLSSSKNEIATLLSGGIDSSITSSICQNIFSINDSYSTGYPFEDAKLNIEKDYALSAADAFGMNHHYYEPTVDEYIKGFLEAISISEEPLHHLQTVLLHLLFKNGIPKNKKIVVHGLGAGFSFGNVTDYLYYKDKKMVKLLSKKPIKQIMLKVGGKGKVFVDTLNESTNDIPLSNPNNPLWPWHDFGSRKWVCNYFKTSEKEIIRTRYDFIKRFEDFSIYDKWSLYSLLGDEDITLSIWTKLGERNNKRLYAPFYDINVLDYVFSMPWKLKLRKQNILRKEIARQAKIPEFIVTRPKSSFGIRPERWSKKGGVFEPLIPLVSKVIDEKHIRSMQSFESKKAMTFWNMLNYAIWKRLCIENEPLEVLIEELDEVM